MNDISSLCMKMVDKISFAVVAKDHQLGGQHQTFKAAG